MNTISINNKLLPIKAVLSKVVELNRPFPKGGVILGVRFDGMPIAFDASNETSPNIVVWDKLMGQGLKILKVIAEFVFRNRKKTQMEFVVLTVNPEEWGELNNYGMGAEDDTSCIGVIPFHSMLARKVLNGLARWVSEPHKAANHPIILLIDGMENIQKMDDEFKNHLRCILDIGRTKRLFVVGTASKKYFSDVQYWLEGFQQEIYGQDAVDLFETTIRQEVIYFIAPSTELI